MSSLFTILRLFTEDVKLSWEGEGPATQDHAVPTAHTSVAGRSDDGLGGFSAPDSYEDVKRDDYSRSPYGRQDGAISQLDLSRERSESDRTEETIHGDEDLPDSPFHGPRSDKTVPDIRSHLRYPLSAVTSIHSEAPSAFLGDHKRGSDRHKSPNAPGERPTVIARATVDTTLAVIPFDAFTRLRHKFPKATGQIVSVILTRFARVTFMTGEPLFPCVS